MLELDTTRIRKPRKKSFPEDSTKAQKEEHRRFLARQKKIILGHDKNQRVLDGFGTG